ALRYLILKLDARRLARKQWLRRSPNDEETRAETADGADTAPKVAMPWLGMGNEELWRRISPGVKARRARVRQRALGQYRNVGRSFADAKPSARHRARSSFRCGFELILENLDVGGAQLVPNEEPMDPGPLRAKRIAELHYTSSPIPRAADTHERADLEDA